MRDVDIVVCGIVVELELACGGLDVDHEYDADYRRQGAVIVGGQDAPFHVFG
jgi:hypothetical protein